MPSENTLESLKLLNAYHIYIIHIIVAFRYKPVRPKYMSLKLPPGHLLSWILRGNLVNRSQIIFVRCNTGQAKRRKHVKKMYVSLLFFENLMSFFSVSLRCARLFF